MHHLISASLLVLASLSALNNSYAQAPGSLDLSFNKTGKVITDVKNEDDIGHQVMIQEDGKIILAGWVRVKDDPDIALVQYNSNGSLDTTFGDKGRVTEDIYQEESG